MAGSETMEETAVTEKGESDQPDPERPGRQVEEQTNQPESQVQTTEQSDRLLKLPMSRVKTIIKMDPEVTLASQEAVATLTKAAELFIIVLSKEAAFKTLLAKRKTLLRKDLEHVFDTRDCYAFLEGAMES